jgi:hypothetical protein
MAVHEERGVVAAMTGRNGMLIVVLVVSALATLFMPFVITSLGALIALMAAVAAAFARTKRSETLARDALFVGCVILIGPLIYVGIAFVRQ